MLNYFALILQKIIQSNFYDISKLKWYKVPNILDLQNIVQIGSCIPNLYYDSKINRDMVLKFPVMAITGPRQSGKTTLCKKIFKEYNYVALASPDNREFAQLDPKGFIDEYNSGVIINNKVNIF